MHAHGLVSWSKVRFSRRSGKRQTMPSAPPYVNTGSRIRDSGPDSAFSSAGGGGVADLGYAPQSPPRRQVSKLVPAPSRGVAPTGFELRIASTPFRARDVTRQEENAVARGGIPQFSQLFDGPVQPQVHREHE